MQKVMRKLSVCVVTYNQEKYVRQCLQSILDQRISFDFEIVISDDFSTDKTRNILKEFSAKYPDIIKLHLQKENIGPYENYSFVHKQASGEYIAHVDGDDYCLPGKLQMQVDLLDRELNCNIVWHKITIEEPSGVLRHPFKKPASDLKFYRKDILQFMAIGVNSSKMYRRSVRDFKAPPFEVIDYFANVEQIGMGYARLVDDQSYGVYRIGIGITTSGNKTRIILNKCFLYFANKYPEYSSNINLAALTYFLGDLKNRRKSWIIFFQVWIRTFKISSLFLFYSHLLFLRRLKNN